MTPPSPGMDGSRGSRARASATLSRVDEDKRSAAGASFGGTGTGSGSGWLPGRGQRRLRIDPPVIERAADDRALDPRPGLA